MQLAHPPGRGLSRRNPLPAQVQAQVPAQAQVQAQARVQVQVQARVPVPVPAQVPVQAQVQVQVPAQVPVPATASTWASCGQVQSRGCPRLSRRPQTRSRRRTPRPSAFQQMQRPQ